MTGPKNIVASHWRRVNPPHNTLVGYVNLLTPSGFLFRGCGVHVHGESRWITFAGSPQLDKDRRHLVSPGGKLRYTNPTSIPNRERHEEFQRQALAAVDRLLGGAP